LGDQVQSEEEQEEQENASNRNQILEDSVIFEQLLSDPNFNPTLQEQKKAEILVPVNRRN